MIKHAAIKCPDGTVISGEDLAGYPTRTKPRHHDIINFMVEIIGYREAIGGKYIQGFVTNDGIFVNRIKGAQIALASKQIEFLRWPPNLYSEDLW